MEQTGMLVGKQVILCSLLCPETRWKIRVGKQVYVFILTDLRSDVL